MRKDYAKQVDEVLRLMVVVKVVSGHDIMAWANSTEFFTLSLFISIPKDYLFEWWYCNETQAERSIIHK